MILRPNLLPALGVFAAAARHRNFAHAAEELHLTASAVSHHVRRLEAALDVVLFHRHARGVSLTGEGRELADAATLAVADLQVVAESLGRSKDAARLRISTIQSFNFCWLLPRLQGFLAQHPGLHVSIETDSALTRFEEGGADLAIRYGPGHWPGLNAHFLMDDELFPVASPSCEGVDAIETPAQIAGMVLLADNGFQGWRDWFRAAGLRGLRLPATHMLSDSSGVMRAAAAGIGAALARKRIVGNYLVDGSLIRLPGPALTARFSYHAVYPAHRAPTPAAEAFIDWLKQEARADASVVPQPEATQLAGKRRRNRRKAP
jgi:LysR family transcriptional regulator, glycine cleavage system transcriptional activator